MAKIIAVANQAFNYLREYVEELSNDKKHVFIIDEIINSAFCLF